MAVQVLRQGHRYGVTWASYTYNWSQHRGYGGDWYMYSGSATGWHLNATCQYPNGGLAGCSMVGGGRHGTSLSRGTAQVAHCPRTADRRRTCVMAGRPTV